MSTGNKILTPKWWWNIPAVLLIAGSLALGIRSMIKDDNRYGWGTFSKQVNFNVEYYWILDNDQTIKHFFGGELRGEAFKKLYYNNTRYSIGAVKAWVHDYLEFLYKNKRKNDAKAIKAIIYYEFNINRKEPFDKHNKKILVIQYP